TIDAPDNVRNFIGNGKIFADNIQNFSANPFRRVDLEAQIDHSVDVFQATQILKQRLASIPNVIVSPPPDVEVLRYTQFGPVLAVRPYTNNTNYWQVYFDTNRAIREAFTQAGFPVPQQHLSMKNLAVQELHDNHSTAVAH